MKIIVGFSKGSTLFGKIIQFITGNPISHCYVRIPFENNSDLSMVFHAAAFNVHYMNYEMFLGYQDEIISEWEIELTKEQWNHAQKVRFEEAGKLYGWLQILGYLWIILKKSKKNPLADGDKSHVCVEIVAKMFKIPNAESLLPHELEQEILEKFPEAKLIKCSARHL